MGADHCVDGSQASLREEVARLTDGAGAEAVVISLGIPTVIEESLPLVRNGGVLQHLRGAAGRPAHRGRSSLAPLRRGGPHGLVRLDTGGFPQGAGAHRLRGDRREGPHLGSVLPGQLPRRGGAGQEAGHDQGTRALLSRQEVTMNGLERRLRRIFKRETGRSLVIAVDHGMALGPMTGIVDLANTVRELDATGKVDAWLITKGMYTYSFVAGGGSGRDPAGERRGHDRGAGAHARGAHLHGGGGLAARRRLGRDLGLHRLAARA